MSQNGGMSQMGRLQVDDTLLRFVEDEVLPGTGVESDGFWAELDRLVHDFAPRNRALLETRTDLQDRIDGWHRARSGQPHDPEAYRGFLEEIGYLLPEGDPVQVTTGSVDAELAGGAGPQLVVPLSNARFALNAANARWGSLYDALYGSDAIPESDGAEIGDDYNPKRGQKVVAKGREVLDEVAPLAEGSHADSRGYRVSGGELVVETSAGAVHLADPDRFAGFVGTEDYPESLLLRHHGLHVELVIDPTHPVGRSDPAGLADIVMEAALTTIMDCEDSVAAVDAGDKVAVYRNWLGLMQGWLSETVEKNGRSFTRRLAADRQYTDPEGGKLTLPGRSVMLVRNVGLLMDSEMVLDGDGRPVPEGILDGVVTALIALHDLKRQSPLVNSRAGSVYIVKPKLHGPDEAAFANDLFDRIEDMLGLARGTLKIGVMDEERRTSANLRECIRATAERIVFVNTGFLDRTGDEIHTAMEAGAVLRKGDMAGSAWFQAYEQRNVDIALACGLGRAGQIGKGMWAMPDRMGDMLARKIEHPRAGANTAWVPSPTAATLHAIHYHQVDVSAVQADLAGREPPELDRLLTLPVVDPPDWDAEAIRTELDNNCQGILGYVVRWVEQGVGCSKVPDIHQVALMEDRATLRISAQHVANWLHHGVVSEAQVREALARMAAVVDRQNADDPHYRPMAADLEASVAFQAACDLIFNGRDQPNGYTEPILHARRAEAKRRAGG